VRPPAVPPSRPSASPPRPLAVPTAPTPPRVAPSKPPEKRARRKSIPDDSTEKVAMPPPHEEPPLTPKAGPVAPLPAPAPAPAPAPEEKKSRRKSRDDLTRPSDLDELEAMQTQTMQGHELPQFEERGSTKVGTPALRATLEAERGNIPIMAAARVHLVKGADGVVRVSIAATENSVPVMLVPIEPGTDLSKLLG
jgi:hypothetical protein